MGAMPFNYPMIYDIRDISSKLLIIYFSFFQPP